MENRYKKFTQMIFKINKQIHKIRLSEMEKVGLKGAHVSCLFYLFNNGEGQTSADLTKLASEDKAAISRAVSDLEKMGYIESSKDEGLKNYRKKLYLTKMGKETAEFISMRSEQIISEGSFGLSKDEIENLYSSLSKISKNLESACKEDSND